MAVEYVALDRVGTDIELGDDQHADHCQHDQYHHGRVLMIERAEPLKTMVQRQQSARDCNWEGALALA